MERTLALIKPDATGKPWLELYSKKAPPAEEGAEGGDAAPAGPAFSEEPETRARDKSAEILARIAKEGFKVAAQKLMYLSKKDAEAFYAEHAGKQFFDTLTSFMSSGAIVALVLEKENAVKEWRALMGPTNSIRAREQAEAEHPLNEERWPLRALYGTDGTRNATHGSDSAYSAWREIGFFFPELEPAVFERSIAVVLPHAVAGEKTASIISALEADDFFVLATGRGAVAPELAATFAGGDEAVAAALAEGEAEAILVEKRGAVRKLRLAAGPAPSVATSNAPTSLHAVYGIDDAHPGVLAAPDAAAVSAATAAFFPGPLSVERTLCVIKPGTADAHYGPIIATIKEHGFTILAETRRTLAREEVEAFYAEHKGRPFFDGLCSYMSSGPVVALALAKPGAIRAWRQLQGPTNTAIARRDKPSSLRGRFGVDGTRNATHGSDSPASAARELRFYFPELAADGSGPSPPPAGDAAIDYIRETVVAHVFDSGKGFNVPKTFDSVLIDALAELARAKPSNSPVEAVRWLGQWLVDNNPRRGTVAHNGPIVVEADDEEGVPATKVAARSRALQRGAPKSVTAAATSPSTGPSAQQPKQRTIVFVLGAPGSGKGTQCERISKTFGYAHLSTGDLLRAEVASGSELGKELNAVMAAGGLVDTPLVLRLVQAAMERDGGNKFLIDGFPRALDQAIAFEKTVGRPAFVLSFDAREHVLEERLVERGKSSGRADDNVESIRKRFATFKGQSEAVIDFYARLGLARKVNSERPVDEVFAAVTPLFKPQAVWLVGGPGSGRSTMAARVAAADLGYTHLSTGDLLRAEVASGSELGHELDAIMKRGDVVPTATTLQLLKAAMDARDPVGRYVLDGFPRDLEQAAAWEKEFGAPEFILSLTAPDSVLLGRTASRGKASGRSDDHAAVVKKQLEAHKKLSQPVLDLYSKQARVRTVDASRREEDVWRDVRAAFAPRLVFVLGGPGSGKGTQCERIVSTFGYAHLSAGDLLRAEVVRGSATGSMINQHIVEGKIVPVEVTLALLKQAMKASRAPAFLIDGFPRAMDQALAFERDVGTADMILFFDCPEATMRARLLDRGKTSGRADDNEASIVKRFRTFVETSMPVINHYAQLGKVRTIDATPSPDVVFSAVRAVFAPTVVYVLGLPGSGKGTQCEKIVKEFGFTHLSTGDLLRAEVARGGPAGEALSAVMAEGKLVSDETILGLLTSAMAASGGRKFLVDGFPRAMDQALKLEALLGKPSLVVHFDVPKEVVKARLLARGKTSGRSDDNEEAIAKRFTTFDEQSAPVIRHYDAQRLVRTINALAPPEVVFSTVKPFFQPQVAVVLGTVGSGRSELSIRAGRELGYHTLRATQLLQAETETDSADGKAIAAAMAAGRTAPLDATLNVLCRAVASSSSTRFLLDGFPRVVSAGFPTVHDQVFALEDRLGACRGAIVLDAPQDVRIARSGAKAPGEVAVIRSRLDAYKREKGPVSAFFQRVGKACAIDTAKTSPDEVFEVARPFLE